MANDNSATMAPAAEGTQLHQLRAAQSAVMNIRILEDLRLAMEFAKSNEGSEHLDWYDRESHSRDRFRHQSTG